MFKMPLIWFNSVNYTHKLLILQIKLLRTQLHEKGTKVKEKEKSKAKVTNKGKHARKRRNKVAKSTENVVPHDFPREENRAARKCSRERVDVDLCRVTRHFQAESHGARFKTSLMLRREQCHSTRHF